MMTRREFGFAAAAGAALGAGSKFGGVQIGAITYSFRTLPSTAADLVKYCSELGLSSIELMSEAAEEFAGAPAMRRPAFGGPPPGGPGGAMKKGGGRPPMTPEVREAIRKAGEERTKWRISASMDKYKELKAMFAKVGVKIDVFKLPVAASMADEEVDYIFTVAKTLGANSVTMELPNEPELSKRAGEFGAKHKVYVGYHNHMQVNASSWETALAQSKYNSINMDVGHFTEAISGSPIEFIKKNAGRISSFHLKDKLHGTKGGGNVEWGKGDVPLKEVLQLMKKEKYSWPANIELEYNIPDGSNVIAEMGKCVKFCQEALG